MPRLTDAERKKISDTILEKTKLAPCAKCKYVGFIVLDGYGLYQMTDSPFGVDLPREEYIPHVATACGNCGFIEFYATEKLGLSGEKRVTDAAAKVKNVIEELRATGLTEEEIKKLLEKP
jgi:predicted nucleic-acid-binding Zn-ribbon protein